VLTSAHSSIQHNSEKAEEAVYSCQTCPNVHFVGRKEFERHTDEQHKKSSPFPCRYSTCKRHEYPFARKENLIRHIKSQHPVDQPNSSVSSLMTQKRLDASGEGQHPVDQPNSPVSSLMAQKRLHASGEDQQPQIDEV